jgi:hypothetical protein
MHFERVISTWNPEELRLSQHLKKTSFRIRKYDFKYLLNNSKMLKEIDERRRFFKDLTFESFENDLEVYSKVIDIADALYDQPYEYNNNFLVIRKDTQNQYRVWKDRTSLKHVINIPSNNQLLDDICEIIDDRIDRQMLLEYQNFLVMLKEVEYIYDIIKTLRKKPYEDKTIQITRYRDLNNLTRIQCYQKGFEYNNPVKFHILEEQPTREEIKDIICIMGLSITVGVYEYVTNFKSEKKKMAIL